MVDNGETAARIDVLSMVENVAVPLHISSTVNSESVPSTVKFQVVVTVKSF